MANTKVSMAFPACIFVVSMGVMVCMYHCSKTQLSLFYTLSGYAFRRCLLLSYRIFICMCQSNKVTLFTCFRAMIMMIKLCFSEVSLDHVWRPTSCILIWCVPLCGTSCILNLQYPYTEWYAGSRSQVARLGSSSKTVVIRISSVTRTNVLIQKSCVTERLTVQMAKMKWGGSARNSRALHKYDINLI